MAPMAIASAMPIPIPPRDAVERRADRDPDRHADADGRVPFHGQAR
jgi:hypothetical protein